MEEKSYLNVPHFSGSNKKQRELVQKFLGSKKNKQI